jgi:hypothetical protein
LERLYRDGYPSGLYFSVSTNQRFIEAGFQPPLVMVIVEALRKSSVSINLFAEAAAFQRRLCK